MFLQVFEVISLPTICAFLLGFLILFNVSFYIICFVKNKGSKMSMKIQRYVGQDQMFDPRWMELIILKLGDAFDIRIKWDMDTAILTGVCTVAGGFIGHYAGGRLGAAVGAGLGSVTGLGISSMVTLREIWTKIKHELQELLYIVFNYLRRLDPEDYINAYKILMACKNNKTDLVLTILEIIAVKLGKEVISKLAVTS